MLDLFLKGGWVMYAILGASVTLPMLNVVGATNEEKHSMKRGVLLVTFGTSIPEARTAFENIERLARARFKGTEIRWAYTSGMIRRKIARQGVNIDSPAVALARMRDEGFTHVAVQSLHVIAGAEYDELRDVTAMFRGGPLAFRRLTLGLPLLASPSDMQRAVKAVLAEVPETRNSGDAVVLMGHGSEHHPADLAYVAAAAAFRDVDPMAFLGTVEGHPTLEDVLANVTGAGIKRAYLMPFMSVAGEHARNDMLGEEPDSWKAVFTKAGIECIPILKGMAEYDAIVAIWLDHLEQAFTALEEE